MLDNTRPPLRVWFLAMSFLGQAKTGLPALALMRHLGVMADADAQRPLEGSVVVDDAYLGGEHPGTGGRGSPNKQSFVAALQLNVQGLPMYANLAPVPKCLKF